MIINSVIIASIISFSSLVVLVSMLTVRHSKIKSGRIELDEVKLNNSENSIFRERGIKLSGKIIDKTAIIALPIVRNAYITIARLSYPIIVKARDKKKKMINFIQGKSNIEQKGSASVYLSDLQDKRKDKLN